MTILTKNISSQDKKNAAKLITPSLIEKFVIRLPKGLRTQIKKLSENNCRSMNSEIIMVLEKHIQQNQMENTASFENDQVSFQVDEEQLDDLHLNRRLEALPASKKAALLALLG